MKTLTLTLLLAVAAASAPAASARHQLRLHKGEALLKRAAHAERTPMKLRLLRRARWYFRTSRKLARRHGAEAVQKQAKLSLVRALNAETAIYIARGSLKRASNRNRRALKLAPDNARVRALYRTIRGGLGRDYFAEASNAQIERKRDQRPFRDRGRSRRR